MCAGFYGLDKILRVGTILMGEKVSAVYFVILFIFFQILEVEPKASDIPDKHSTAELQPPSDLFVFILGRPLLNCLIVLSLVSCLPSSSNCGCVPLS